MKNLFKMSLLAIVFVFSFTNCCKNKLTHDTYFYMDANTDENGLKLYIDDEYKGDLPVINAQGNYGHYEEIQSVGLYVSIKTEKFKADVKNAEGKIIASATFKRNLKSISTLQSSSSLEVTQDPEYILIAFEKDPFVQ